MTAVIPALGVSALYGTSQFLARSLAKRVPATPLAPRSQITSGTVLLAHRITVEQLSRVQGVGVGLALNGKENPMFVSYTE